MATEQNSSLAIGFVIGLGFGAVAGLLLAPQSGKESQKWIADNAKTGVENLKAARQRVEESVQNYATEGRAQVVAAVGAGKEAYRDAVSNG